MANTTQNNTLDLFHPLIATWFNGKYGAPTDIQRKAWPVIASGGHVLVTAPTGSGKTLTAFLWAINTFVTAGAERTGFERVLYISPLKALNNDIRRNLEQPIAELRERFAEAGEAFPDISVNVRSGDTQQNERRRMLKHPPDILITTPESLNVLLSSKSGIGLLKGFGTVILDEIHAVADTKRGTYLMTAIERLVPICGEFKRIALSATVNPLETVADFVGGREYEAGNEEPLYRKRNVRILKSDIRKSYDITVEFPDPMLDPDNEDEWWPALTDSLRAMINTNKSTLLFANSRRMVEKIARFINDREEEHRVYSHHGSLSKEIRRVVEQRLKDGELAGIVATSSLELGIDIGAVDRVVMIQAPYTVSSAIQRVGRAGHGVGMTSAGTFAPIHSRELIEAAVLAKAIETGEIETIHPIEKPLDVLAQIILSMTLSEAVPTGELYDEIRASYPYRDLTRREFDLVVAMLAGRYADTRIRELKPRIIHDRIDDTIRARDNVRPLLYLAGGVIPDRGYFNLRVADTKAKIGELDEEFVWERSLGDAFPFGNSVWRIVRVTHNDVEVAPADKSNSVIPFWKAEDLNRPFHFSEHIGSFLEETDTRIASDDFHKHLMSVYMFSEPAATALIDYLKRQKASTGTLPHRHALIVEHFNDPANLSDSKQTVLHTLWGGAVNRPFALAIAAAWEEKYSYPLEMFVNNDCIMLNLPHKFSTNDVLDLADPDDIPRLLRAKLESTGFFGGRFKENAQRALLLPRKSFRERMPRWMNRLRSKKLLESISGFDDFPILLETWRECLTREFDLETLSRLLDEIRTGEIAIVEAETQIPSPFASGVIWRQTNFHMYEDDSPGGKLKTNLSDELIREAVFSSGIRPSLPDDLIEAFDRKVRRTAPGYTPDTSTELLEWVRERLFIPAREWSELLDAVTRDHDADEAAMIDPIRDRLYEISGDYNEASGMTALENLPFLSAVLGIEEETAEHVRESLNINPPSDDDRPLASFLRQWLRFYGPVKPSFVRQSLGLSDTDFTAAVEELIEDKTVVLDVFRDPETSPVEELCDAENLEILLRMRRARQRPAFEPLPSEMLPLFLARHQGIIPRGEGVEDLEERLEPLLGYPARASLWETEILPARMSPYYPEWLDTAMREGELVWFGHGNERFGFSFPDDIALLLDTGSDDGENADEDDITDIMRAVLELLDTTVGNIGFDTIVRSLPYSNEELTDALWELGWRGRITNDDFGAMRKGILTRFTAGEVQKTTGRRNRAGFKRWKNTRPFTGHWLPLERADGTDNDPLGEHERNKDRLRQLFMRYGILFRELLANELPAMSWRRLFRSLRIMELSGEIYTGYFFRDIPGLQFCSREAMRGISSPLPEDAVFWMNACDPASLAGIGPENIKSMLPSRIPSNHIVWIGATVALISKRNGGNLTFLMPPDHPRIGECLGLFRTMVGRRFKPLGMVEIETVNGLPALESPYRTALTESGFVKDYSSLVLRKQY